MKKQIEFIRRNVLRISALFLVIILFSACKKFDSPAVNTPTAGLMAFNLAPDQGSVGVALGNNIFTNAGLNYTSYTGGYNNIFTGNREVVSYSFLNGADLASSNYLFADSSYYSLFVVGANGKYDNVIVKDQLDSLPTATGKAFVRYINAIPDSVLQPMVKISGDGSDLFNSIAPFKTVSNFKEVAPGSVAINVNSGTAINASRNIDVEAEGVYSILLTGLPNATDTTQAVQIKFIKNGSVL